MPTVNVRDLTARKRNGVKITMLTCYDYTFARLLDRCGIDVVLVGDSLGNVMLGYEDTTQVRLSDMLHHVRAVARGLTVPLLCADMPFLTYHAEVGETLRTARRLVQAGAKAVKLEGGREICPQVQALVQGGVAVMGHLGFTPQSVHRIGGHVVQGRGEDAAQRLRADARALQDAGVFALVLELVPAVLAAEISAVSAVPVIGIGAGRQCDGQVLVLHDLLGCDAEFTPRFLKKYENLAARVQNAVQNFVGEVKDGSFPEQRHEYE